MQNRGQSNASDDAPTPLRGTPVAGVRRLSTRPNVLKGSPADNRRAGWLVVGFCVLLAIVLALFWLLGDDPGDAPVDARASHGVGLC